MNLTIVNDEYILPWMTNSTLTTTMDWGSRINLTYDFNDTNDVYEIEYDRFYDNTAGHQWDVEGTFYPFVSHAKSINNNSIVRVLPSLHRSSLDSVRKMRIWVFFVIKIVKKKVIPCLSAMRSIWYTQLLLIV